MKKTLALLLALLMLAACLAGCAAKQETPAAAETTAAETSNQPVSEETYYYICPLANLEYWLAHKAGLEDACRELNVTPKFVGDDGLDVDAMCAVIETALNDPNCAGIVMQANFADAYEPYVQQAYEKGIPVCYQTVDGVDGSKRLCFLGTDYVEYGKIMMRQAAEATGGKGSVIRTLLGIVVVRAIINIASLLSFDAWAQNVLTGALLLAVLIVDRCTREQRLEDAV